MRTISSATMSMVTVVALAACGTLQASQVTDQIESSAKSSYVFRTYLKGDDIKVQAASDSVVALSGTVSEWSHRSLAEEVVADLPGVKRVNNNLVVKNGQPIENSDAWIRVKVATVLMFHRNVSAVNTDVTIKDGLVTLRGEAQSAAQKELTTEYVKDVDGVRDVKNSMTVAKAGKTVVEKVTESIDDASITAQVKLALMFHRSTSSFKTKVTTKDGIVTVSGIVKNSAEKDLIGKLVNNINGVKGLTNSMTIGEVSMK